MGHRWTRWKYVKSVGRYDELLKKTCKRCGRTKFYKGVTETTIVGEKIPFNNSEERPSL